MNKLLISILMIMVLVLSVSMVSAVVTVQNTFDKDDPTFGGPDEEASNPDEDEEKFDNSPTIVVKNNNATAVDVTTVSFNYNYGFDESDLNLTVVGSLPTGITNSSDGSLILKARITEKLDAVESDNNEDDYLEPKAFQVADAVLTFSDSSTVTVPLYMQRENELEFKGDKVYLFIGDSENDDSLKDGDKTNKEIMPGEDLKFDFTVENKYSGSDNVRIEDIIVRMLLDDKTDNSWDWSDIDEETDIGTLDDNEEEPESISFTLDDDIDSYGDYEMEVYLSGKDDYNAEHGQKLVVKLDINREYYEFRLKKAAVNPSSMSCVRGDAEVDVKIESLGRKGDNEVSLYISNTNLGIDFEKTDIDIEKFGGDDSYVKRLSFTVADDMKAGTYPIRVSVYYSGDEDEGVPADEKDVVFIVDACETDTTPVEVTTPTVDTEIVVPADVLEEFGITEVDEEEGFTESGWFMALLIVLVVAALGGLTALIVLLVKRP